MASETLVSWGTRVEELDAWCTSHSLLILMVACIVLGVIAAAIDGARGGDRNHIAGIVLKIGAATSSVLTSFKLLLPFVARALWGTADSAIPPPPPCIGKLSAACIN